MFANGKSAINEFYRVLKPDGKLYIMIDLWRWYLGLFLEGKMNYRDLVIFIIKLTLKASPTLYSKKSFAKLITNAGFEIVREGQEGHAYFGSEEKKIDPKLCIYPTQPVSREQLWEVCAVKSRR
jgi:hypothetical protein